MRMAVELGKRQEVKSAVLATRLMWGCSEWVEWRRTPRLFTWREGEMKELLMGCEKFCPHMFMLLIFLSAVLHAVGVFTSVGVARCNSRGVLS